MLSTWITVKKEWLLLNHRRGDMTLQTTAGGGGVGVGAHVLLSQVPTLEDGDVSSQTSV